MKSQSQPKARDNTPTLIERTKKVFDAVRLALKDQTYVRFELSFKFYRKSGDSITIPMELTRTAPDSWNASFPSKTDTRPPESAESIGERLSSIENAVTHYVATESIEEVWLSIESTIKDAIKRGITAETLILHTEIPQIAIAGRSYDAHLYAPAMAIAYALESANALSIGDMKHAAFCADEGLRWCHPEMLIHNHHERFSARAKTGGEGRANKYEPLKCIAAELLTTRTPHEGWNSISEAVAAIEHHLTTNHLDLVESCGLKTYNLSNTLRRWVCREPERLNIRIKKRSAKPI